MIKTQVIFILSILFFSKLCFAEYAIFAGGCFWCMEPPFDKLKGVISTTSGYIGGAEKNAKYYKVASGATKHFEAIRVEFDPKKIKYTKLLNTFWRNIDPTNPKGQFVDIGPQYTTAIFYLNEKQKIEAEKSKSKLEKSKRFKEKVVTKIIKATEFFPAEENHQDYYKKNPVRYKLYRYHSKRDQFIDKHWK